MIIYDKQAWTNNTNDEQVQELTDFHTQEIVLKRTTDFSSFNRKYPILKYQVKIM